MIYKGILVPCQLRQAVRIPRVHLVIVKTEVIKESPQLIGYFTITAEVYSSLREFRTK